jgi:hypothetical protein
MKKLGIPVVVNPTLALPPRETVSQSTGEVAAVAQGFACRIRQLFFHGRRWCLLLPFHMQGGPDSIQEVADIAFAEPKRSLHDRSFPADSAALTLEPRRMENEL